MKWMIYSFNWFNLKWEREGRHSRSFFPRSRRFKMEIDWFLEACLPLLFLRLHPSSSIYCSSRSLIIFLIILLFLISPHFHQLFLLNPMFHSLPSSSSRQHIRLASRHSYSTVIGWICLYVRTRWEVSVHFGNGFHILGIESGMNTINSFTSIQFINWLKFHDGLNQFRSHLLTNQSQSDTSQKT